ncbi:MAG: adenine deaminase [Victivallaceae bacterium]|nr:adenine deaminase [Victivallaceae bacterium]
MVSRNELKVRISQALAEEPADLVIKNVDFLSVTTGEMLHGDIALCGNFIVGTGENYCGKVEIDGAGMTAVPGFVDAHLHIESSMITPYEFERCVLPRGTTTAVCDPHEMCNVKGIEALKYFFKCANQMLMDLRVQLSSCVPATHMETSGAKLNIGDLLTMKNQPQCSGLAEFMNFPGVLMRLPEVLEKLEAFSAQNIDGHCPLLSGKELNAYIAAGIKNDHECSSKEEAFNKLTKGMRVFIREGSVAKNLHELATIINHNTVAFTAFCTDDRNPLEIAAEGHLDYLIRTAIELGVEPALAYRAASRSGAEAFALNDRGIIAPGYRADIVLLSDYRRCQVAKVIKNGQIISDESFAQRAAEPSADFSRKSIIRNQVKPNDFRIVSKTATTRVIEIIPNSLITNDLKIDLPFDGSEKNGLPEQDILKVAVLARHGVNENIGRGFVKGFGIKSGAIASSVGHDSHNICVTGTSEEDMATAVNALIEVGGGMCVAQNGKIIGLLELPIAGIISDLPFEKVADQLRMIRNKAAETGCPLDEPFLQLAFLPLPVIPFLKITDFGLVDVTKFEIVET